MQLNKVYLSWFWSMQHLPTFHCMT